MNHCRLTFALTLSLALAACAPMAPRPDGARDGSADTGSRRPVADKPARAPDAAHQADIEAWRTARVARLTAPEGWLSLVGLHWLPEGDHSVGSGEGSAIRLAAGPARLGDLRVRGKDVWFRADRSAPVFIHQSARVDVDDERRTWHLLGSDASGKQTTIRSEPVVVLLIERDGKPALRVKDANAPTRTGFTGIEYFPIDADFKVEGRFVPHAETTYFEIQTVLGTTERMVTPGVIHFEIAGKPYSIHPVLEEGTTDWFFIFGDRTNGRDTYGAGRFLYAAPAVDGKVTLDFNRAYNPPCAFTAYSTCPLPPPENRLDLRVTAGERKYRGGTGSP
jgi:hypothetical protein